MSTQNVRGPRPRKEAFFVQVESADKTPLFFNATKELGKPMPYSKPLATCALRVSEGAVMFSLLKLSNRTRQTLLEAPLELPRGPLARLERKVATLSALDADDVVRVEVGKVEGVDGEHVMSMSRDENGVVSLELVGDEITFTLPKSAIQVSLFLRSPKTGRVVAVGFIGHIGKPESTESLTRAVAQVINHASGLAEFRLLSGIERANVPSAPGRFTVRKVARKAEDTVRFAVPVRLWSEENAPVSAGLVQVEVDLDTANPVSGKLLFHLTPDAALVEVFEPYRSNFDAAVSAAFMQALGADELTDIVCDIALGDVGSGTLGRLREASGAVTGLDISPRQFAMFVPVAA